MFLHFEDTTGMIDDRRLGAFVVPSRAYTIAEQQMIVSSTGGGWGHAVR